MSDQEVEELKVLLAEKEAAIRRKEKKLELKKRAETGAPLREAEERLKAQEKHKEVAVDEANKAFRRTLSTDGVPLVERKKELVDEIRRAEEESEEKKQELANLEAELNAHQEQYNAIIGEKQTFCNDLLAYVKELQDELASKLTRIAGTGDGAAPYRALQVIEELTKEREAEISNNERQLREICQIISMKKEREHELKVESEKKIRDAIIKKDEEILTFVQQCQRERADGLERVERLRSENEQQAQLLHWKHQKTLRDMKDRKIDRKSPKVSIREQITVAAPGTVTRKTSGAKGEKTRGSDVSSAKPETPRMDSNYATQSQAIRSQNALNEKREAKEDEKIKIRRLESEITRVQQEFQRTQRQLEYKITYERGQAEQFERENQKLEEQAEHLAQTLQKMKSEIKRQQAAAELQNPNPTQSAKSIGWSTHTPRRSPRPIDRE
ncbi:Paramyosin [Diplonema papillatum]|nr:Paramyosin [Diplonema papillatum]